MTPKEFAALQVGDEVIRNGQRCVVTWSDGRWIDVNPIGFGFRLVNSDTVHVASRVITRENFVEVIEKWKMGEL